MSLFDTPSRLDVVNVDSIGDPAFIVDTHGVVVSCNTDAAWLLGKPVRDIIGRRCFSVVRACLPTGEPACSAECPLIPALGTLPGPPAVELVVGGGQHLATKYAINVQHIPLSDAYGSRSGLLHIMTLAGPADEDFQDADMSLGASYLG